jgi:RimJ/RimL family protein N-acetyltransferase
VPLLAPPDMPLSDGVVTLRAWRADDAQAVVAALQDPDIPRWTGVPSPYGIREFEAWMDEQAQQRSSGLGLHLLVVDGQDRLLGAVGVQGTEEEAPDIGYWCVREHRGRGYIVRAVRLLRSYVEQLGCSRVDILTHHQNCLSHRVAEAAGFRRQPGLTRLSRLGTEPTFVRFISEVATDDQQRDEDWNRT